MKRMNILGLDLDCLSYEEMFDIFDNWLEEKNKPSHYISLINVFGAVSALLDQDLKNIYQKANLRGIDGMPFLHWARLFFYKNSDRFYAPDLMLEVSKRAREKNYTFYLYGGYPGAVDQMEIFLTNKFEGLRIVGKFSPPFRPLTEEEDSEFCAEVNKLKPDFFWVGLGTPKQDFWIYDHVNSIKGTIFIPSGATFDFFSGRIIQAPKWIRIIGFEWFFRLTKDFKRLWKRYTLYNLIFIGAFLLQLLGLKKFKSNKS